jgi:hypothetical protein
MTFAALGTSAAAAMGMSAGAATAAGSLAAGVASSAIGAGINSMVGGGGGGGGGQQQGGMGQGMLQGMQDYIKNIDMSKPAQPKEDIQPNFARNMIPGQNQIPAPNNGQPNMQQPTQQFSPMPGGTYSPVAQSPSQGFGQAPQVPKFGQDSNGQILGIHDFIKSLTS